MKKILILILTTLMLLSMITGCSSSKNTQETNSDNTAPTPTDKPIQGITVNKIPFEVLDFNLLSESQKNTIESNKALKGYTYWEDNGSYIIVIFAGEKPTAGYNINVLSIEDNEGRTVIAVEEKTPQDIAAQVISYPYTIIRAKSITNNFIISDTAGNYYEPINDSGKQTGKKAVLEAEGIFIGGIDTNTIEIKLSNGEVKAFMSYVLSERFEELKENTKLSFTYYKNEYEQLIINDFSIVE